LGAYKYLLDWHTRYYKKNANDYQKEKSKPFHEDGSLTNKERKRILINNIYGVDLDPQTIEVIKLSLLLKALESETASSVRQLGNTFERVLPSFDPNIKCGNSLVGLDFQDDSVRPFGWEQAFAHVFEKQGKPKEKVKDGGFDIIIGNPPYVHQELLGLPLKTYLHDNNKVWHGSADLYAYFFEKGMQLLKEDGVFSIIVANKWMRANYGEPLRRYLKDTDILEITDFGDLPVFQQATTYPCIITIRKSVREKNVQVSTLTTLDFDDLQSYVLYKAEI
jgi:type I restriction-modification system DNA methylase subunit